MHAVRRGEATAAAGRAIGEAAGLYDENGDAVDVHAVRRTSAGGVATAAAGRAIGKAAGLYDGNGDAVDVHAVRRGEANRRFSSPNIVVKERVSGLKFTLTT